MKTIIERAADKGWLINEGTLQAKGLFNAYRNNAATDADVTVWCQSRNEAAREALKMDGESIKKVGSKKKWTVYDPHRRTYIAACGEPLCEWHNDRDKAYLFDTKVHATASALEHGLNSRHYVIAAHEPR